MADRGAPTKYNDEYPKKIVDFFNVKFDLATVTARKLQSGVIEFPTFEKFAADNDVHVDTLIEWTKVHPEFSEAYKRAKHFQKAFLIQCGLNGLYAPAAFCFVAKNCTDMRDQIDVKQKGETTTRIVYMPAKKPKGAAIDVDIAGKRSGKPDIASTKQR